MQKNSRTQKLLYSIILLVFSIFIFEASSHVIYSILNYEIFPFSTYDESIQRQANSILPTKSETKKADGGELRWNSSYVEVIHPYLGFVIDPQITPDTSYLGFPQKRDDPLNKSNKNSITVAILGGSFAKGVSLSGEAIIQSKLSSYGIKSQVLTIAMGGYKQPQQLLSLAYLLSHGAKIDVVVNIDGFNEVALPQADNIPKGVNPFYPRAWYTRTLQLDDQVTLRKIGRAISLEEDREQWANIINKLPKFSIIRNVVWKAYDKVLEKRITQINDGIRRSKAHNATRFLTTGPDLGIKNSVELYQQIALHWKTCSLLMKALCDSHGIKYIHILQPNQYFESGRTLTEREQQIAFRKNHEYRPGVVQGYPELLAIKNDLLHKGVNFHDLTMIYKNIGQEIYNDDCCHPNKFGYRIIAEYIAELIAGVLNQQTKGHTATDGS